MAKAQDTAASTSQPTDTEADSEVKQENSTESLASASAGFQAVQQSADVQQPTQHGAQHSHVLHVCLGPLPDAHTSCKAFYFLQDQPGKMAVENMESQIECGILSEGPSLKMLQQVTCLLVQAVQLLHFSKQYNASVLWTFYLVSMFHL